MPLIDLFYGRHIIVLFGMLINPLVIRYINCVYGESYDPAKKNTCAHSTVIAI